MCGAICVFGRPFVKRFALCYQTVVCPVCLSCHACNGGVLWPNSWMDQDETWHAGRPRPWPHCVRWGPSSSPQRAVVKVAWDAGGRRPPTSNIWQNAFPRVRYPNRRTGTATGTHDTTQKSSTTEVECLRLSCNCDLICCNLM